MDLSLLKLFGQYIIEKIVERTGAAFHWPTNFAWPPGDANDGAHHHHHHHEQQKLFSFDHIHDLHM